MHKPSTLNVSYKYNMKIKYFKIEHDFWNALSTPAWWKYFTEIFFRNFVRMAQNFFLISEFLFLSVYCFFFNFLLFAILHLRMFLINFDHSKFFMKFQNDKICQNLWEIL